MPGLEPHHGLRVVADPSALDAATWTGDDVLVLRIAPDEALALGAVTVAIDDEHAIVETETGSSTAWRSLDDLRPHIEWAVPTARPALAQGSVAGVPARLWLPDDGDALLVAAKVHVATLTERLR